MNWTSERLKELSKVITKGTTPTSVGFAFAERGIRFLRVENIKDGTVNFERDTLFIDERTHNALGRSQIRAGDILVSIAGTIGRAGVVPDAAPALNCNQAVAIVRTNGALFRPFVRYWIESPDAQKQMRAATVTGTISNLSLTQLGDLRIPVPPLSEQRRIADVLERAEALRSKRRAALAQLDIVEKSIFLDLLHQAGAGVVTVSVEDAMEAIIDYRGKSPSKTTTGIPLVTARIVKDGELLEPNEFIAEKDYAAWMRRGFPKRGDVLFTTEAPLGEVAQLDGRKVALAQRLLVLRGKSALLDNTFLKHALTSRQVRTQIDARATGSTVRGIRQRELRKVMLPVPPLAVQRTFAHRIATVEKLKAAHRSSMAEMDTLFGVLQQRAFKGQL